MMCNWIRGAALVIALVATAILAAPPAKAQATQPYRVSAVDLEIAPAHLDKFLEALRENGAATIREPGCLRYDILQSASNPSQIFIYEVYENEAAVQAHRAADHFKKYQETTRDMVVKRQSRPMVNVVSYSKAK